MTGKLFEIRSVEGRGRGIFAVRDIKVGELILDEAPLLNCPRAGKFELAALVLILGIAWQSVMDGWEGYLMLLSVGFFACNIVWKLAEYTFVLSQFRSLDESQRQQLFRLQAGSPSTVTWLHTLMVFRSNSLPNDGRGAVYATASIVNHSCAPNAFHHYSSERKREMLYAMRPIKRSEEITISYIDVMQAREERQEVLLNQYNFACACPVCSASEEQRQVSDRRRCLCASLAKGVQASGGMGYPDSAVDKTEELLEAIDAEFGDPTYKGDACYEAWLILSRGGDKKKARAWASKAHKYLLAIKGASHPQVKEAKTGSSQ